MKKNIINKGLPLSVQTTKAANKKSNLNVFYDGFRDGIREIKLSLDGKTVLKEAKTWITEI